MKQHVQTALSIYTSVWLHTTLVNMGRVLAWKTCEMFVASWIADKCNSQCQQQVKPHAGKNKKQQQTGKQKNYLLARLYIAKRMIYKTVKWDCAWRDYEYSHDIESAKLVWQENGTKQV